MEQDEHHPALHRAHVIHKISGRVRLRLPHAKNRPSRIEHVRKTLAGMPGVNRVEANPTTGSMLLHYDRAQDSGDSDFLKNLAEFASKEGLFKLPGDQQEYDQLASDIETEAQLLARRSKTAEAIVDNVEAANILLKRATGNTLDLKIMFPLGLGALSAATLGAEMGTPVWITLALSAFHSFVSLHSTRELPHVHDSRSAPAGEMPHPRSQ